MGRRYFGCTGTGTLLIVFEDVAPWTLVCIVVIFSFGFTRNGMLRYGVFTKIFFKACGRWNFIPIVRLVGKKLQDCMFDKFDPATPGFDT